MPAWLSCALAIALSVHCGDEDAPEEDPPSEPTCAHDASEGPDSAMALEVGETIEGSLCPREDQDWYDLRLADDARLLSIGLAMTGTRSPVEPTYAVWSIDDSGEPDEVVAAPKAEEIGGALSGTHCLEPGDYLLVIRDQGDDAQDMRDRYRLDVETAPESDELEPNDDADNATALSQGIAQQGYISCAGDEDWFAFDVSGPGVLHLSLSADLLQYEPEVRVLNSDLGLLVAEDNPAGASEPTDIDILRVLPGAGTYYIVVADDDGQQSDPAVSYALSVEAIDDADDNEPNNHPAQATALAAAPESCEMSWSGEFTATGSIGSPGDTDWFVLPTEGCNGGLVEAEVEFEGAGLSDDERWQLQTQVQASVALVKAHPDTPCDENDDCVTLNIACDEETGVWDCAGYLNSCAADGFCKGATVCLPNGQCGADQTERHYQRAAVPSGSSGPPPPNRASLSAPWYRDEAIYVRVTDFQSDGGDPDATYTLRVRVRTDPDAYDRANVPNNLYGNILTSDNLPVRESRPVAVSIPVHDCTADVCCTPDTWIEGAISYEDDLDWFYFDHPCPGADCLLRVHYEVDNGSVNHALFLYQGWRRPFFSFEIEGSDTFGDDECLYAYFEHANPYYVLIRDQADDGRDHDPDQSYRFCVEKYLNACAAPCAQTATEGCTAPQTEDGGDRI